MLKGHHLSYRGIYNKIIRIAYWHPNFQFLVISPQIIERGTPIIKGERVPPTKLINNLSILLLMPHTLLKVLVYPESAEIEGYDLRTSNTAR